MNRITIPQDIPLFYVTATSFPEGVLDAHAKIHSLIPLPEERRFFGISYPIDGTIVYKAAAEELEVGEAEKYDCEKFVIKAGEYLYEDIKDFASDISIIDKTFKELLANPELDPNGYCLEWYMNDTDVRCMVPLRTQSH